MAHIMTCKMPPTNPWFLPQCGVDIVDTDRRSNDRGLTEDYFRYFTQHFTDREWDAIKRCAPATEPYNPVEAFRHFLFNLKTVLPYRTIDESSYCLSWMDRDDQTQHVLMASDKVPKPTLQNGRVSPTSSVELLTMPVSSAQSLLSVPFQWP